MEQIKLIPFKKMRWLSWSGFLCWLGAAVTAGVYAWSWKTMRWPPDFRWMLATLGAALLFGILCMLIGLFHFLRGPRRTVALAGLLFGTIPLALLALLSGELYWRAETRQTIERGWWVDPISYLASDVGDGEATLRKLRRTQGSLCVLIDDGSVSDPAAILTKMDEHIGAMCKILEVAPKKLAYWVRYPIIGQRGRSMIGWAICDRIADQSADELGYLDKHEMAHAIAALTSSPESNPPSVLGEGWAETQSNDVLNMCRTLVDARKGQQDFPTWQDIVGPDWYSRSYGPVYTIGGPAVAFLLEKYDGASLHKLFDHVRHDTFEVEFHRVYGKTWPEIEPEFETWLADKIPAEASGDSPTKEPNLRDRISLSENVSSSEWENLWTTAREFYEIRSNPSNAKAFRVMSETKDESTQAVRTSIVQSRVLLTDDQALLTYEEMNSSEAFAVTPSKSFRATRTGSGNRRSGCLVSSRSEKASLREFISNNWSRTWLASDLVEVFELNMGATGNATIESLTQDPEKGTWTLKANGQYGDVKFSLVTEVDPKQNWRCVSMQTTVGDQVEEKSYVHIQVDDDWVLRDSTTSFTNGGKVEKKIIDKFSLLADRDVLSMRDEILSIPATSCANNNIVPLWLQIFRIAACAWAGLGILLGLLVKLFPS